MSFYHDKRKAYQLIDHLYMAGKSTEEITFKIQTMYGFGELIVKKRTKLLEKLAKNDEKNPKITDK